MRYRIRKIHFVGIGGAGMSGIAEVLRNLGYKISGSDVTESVTCDRLRKRDIDVRIGHAAANVDGADAVVFSSAVPSGNVELAAARRQGIPVVPRVTMLAELLRLRQGIAVAGTHGKTTITSMISHILNEAGLDPTFIIGGLLRRIGRNAKLGAGEFIVVEADESDASFLNLHPVISVVSNVDSDHLQTYGQDFQCLKRAFVRFMENLPFYGLAVVCFDDEHARSCASMCSRRIVSYGIRSRDADFRATDLRFHNGHSTFTMHGPVSGRFKVQARGMHNVLNTLAAVAVAHEIGISKTHIARALKSFEGIARRIEDHGELVLDGKRFELVDDYGHHPTEMEATIDAVRRSWPKKRLVVVFQPHRYSRTRDVFEGLAGALSRPDALVLMEVYPAGEEPIPAASSEALARAIRMRGQVEPVYAKTLDKVVCHLQGVLHDDDVVLTLGAGSVGQIPEMIKQACT